MRARLEKVKRIRERIKVPQRMTVATVAIKGTMDGEAFDVDVPVVGLWDADVGVDRCEITITFDPLTDV